MRKVVDRSGWPEGLDGGSKQRQVGLAIHHADQRPLEHFRGFRFRVWSVLPWGCKDREVKGRNIPCELIDDLPRAVRQYDDGKPVIHEARDRGRQARGRARVADDAMAAISVDEPAEAVVESRSRAVFEVEGRPHLLEAPSAAE